MEKLKYIHRWMMLCIALLILFFGGCITNTKHQPKVVLVTLAGKPLNLIPTDIAEKEKYFQKMGIDVEIKTVRGGTDATLALISRSADFGVMSVEHLLKAAVKGKNLKLVATINQYPGFALIVSSKASNRIKTVKDLKNKKVATSSPGGAFHIALTYILKKNGVRESEVQMIPLQLEAVVPAIEQGQIDAAMTLEPYVTQLVERKSASVLVDLRSGAIADSLYGGKYIQAGLVTREDVISANPEIVNSMICAYDSALQWIQKRSYKEVIEKVYGVDKINNPSQIKALENQKDLFPENTKVDARAVQNVIDVMEEMNVVPKENRIMATDIIGMISVGKFITVEQRNRNSDSKTIELIILGIILMSIFIIIPIVVFKRKILIEKTKSKSGKENEKNQGKK